MDNVLETIKKLILPILDEEGVELWDMTWTSDHGQRILRIMIERTGGVTVDDCSRVSRSVEDLLEVKEVVTGRYHLEVSSPGLDRPLRSKNHFERFIGEQVRVTTKHPIEGRKNYKGELKSVCGDSLSMEIDRHIYSIPLDEVAHARLEIS